MLIGSAGGALLAFSIVLAILAYAAGASALGSPQPANAPDALQAMVLVVSLALVGALSLPAAYNSARSLRGRAVAAGCPRRLGIGQALIATMCGLAIAIVALIPFNYFTRKLSQLQFELESAATNVEVMVQAAKQKGLDTIEFRREDTHTPA